jgi:tryptophan synthase alpha chain
MIGRIRARTSVPVGVGFGIRDAATARRVARLADAVVIGSRIVQEMADAGDNAAARAGEVLREFRDAMDNTQALAT